MTYCNQELPSDIKEEKAETPSLFLLNKQLRKEEMEYYENHRDVGIPLTIGNNIKVRWPDKFK